MRRLIINADDFGQSAGINQGIAACHEARVVLSASLMVRWPAAAEAASFARRHPSLSVGLHIDLCEWTYRDGAWCPLYEVVARDDATQVRDEIARQLEAFTQLMGCPPTHLDSHQHVHREAVVRGLAIEVASRLGVPLRQCDPRVRYDGRFYGQGRSARPCPELISVEHLIRIIETLPDGITELGCHPGIGRGVVSVYSDERETEVATLCDARIPAALAANQIALASFRDVVSADV